MDSLALWLMTFFAFKHFVCDFPLQATPYMYANKGNLRHPGGYVHAGVHALATILGLSVFFDVDGVILFYIGLFEMIAHYSIDFFKVNLNNHFGLKPNNSEWFWILLGFDQLLHTLTYLAIAYYLVNYG